MATILIKRGTTVPTTSKLTRNGELAVNYSTGYLYVRCSKGVMCINTNSIVSASSSSSTNTTGER